ncbi:MAG: hypothetical protein GY940_39390 [bacterium]|nr:hypothetical protein [bacterium]
MKTKDMLNKKRYKMRVFKLIAIMAFMTFMVYGCNGKPDLVITDFRVTGVATFNANNSVELPIRVVVKNQGTVAAGTFKVSVDYTGPKGTFVVAFTVPGQSSPWYPFTGTSLGAGNSVTFNGKLTFHPSVHGVGVSLKALADSCSGDEFMPDYCRVRESNEDNNESVSLSVLLPQKAIEN